MSLDRLWNLLNFKTFIIVTIAISVVGMIFFFGQAHVTGSQMSWAPVVLTGGFAVILLYYYKMSGPIIANTTIQGRWLDREEAIPLLYHDVLGFFFGPDYVAWKVKDSDKIQGAKVLQVTDVTTTWRDVTLNELKRRLKAYEDTMGSGSLRVGTLHMRLPIDIEAYRSALVRKRDWKQADFDSGGMRSRLEQAEKMSVAISRMEKEGEKPYDARFFIFVADEAESQEDLENLLDVHAKQILNMFDSGLGIKAKALRDLQLYYALSFFRPQALVGGLSGPVASASRPVRVMSYDLVFQNPFVTRKMPPLEKLLSGIYLGTIRDSAIPVSWNPEIQVSYHWLILGTPGCLVGDTQIVLDSGAVQRIDRLGSRHLEPIRVSVRTGRRERETATATTFFNLPPQPIIEVQTASGRSLRGTYDHPLLCLHNQSGESSEHEEVWKRLEEIAIGDRLRVVNSFESSSSAQKASTSSPSLWKWRQAQQRAPVPEFERVVAVRRLHAEPVYDIEVPDGHQFIANGFVSHNSGKSTLAKTIMIRGRRDMGVPVWIIDPAGEYADAVKSLGPDGVVIDFSRPDGDKVNPFILYGRDPTSVATNMSEMLTYISGLFGPERAFVDKVIRECYESYGISIDNKETWKDDLSNYVTMATLYQYIQSNMSSFPLDELPYAKSVLGKIARISVGAYKMGRATFNLDELWRKQVPVCFNLKGLETYMQRAIVWSILTQLYALAYIRYEISETFNLMFIVDEAHLFARPVEADVPGGYIEPPLSMFVRMMRKRGVGLCLISHMPGDFVPPGETTSIIFQAAGTIFLFGSTEDSYLRFCANALHLAEDEVMQMLWMGRGEGMLRYYGDPRAMALRLDPERAALAKRAEDMEKDEKSPAGRTRPSAPKKGSLRELYDEFLVRAEIKNRFPE